MAPDTRPDAHAQRIEALKAWESGEIDAEKAAGWLASITLREGTRPSVTVVGEVHYDVRDDCWRIDLDAAPGLGLVDGGEVEVTIRKYERSIDGNR